MLLLYTLKFKYLISIKVILLFTFLLLIVMQRLIQIKTVCLHT